MMPCKRWRTSRKKRGRPEQAARIIHGGDGLSRRPIHPGGSLAGNDSLDASSTRSRRSSMDDDLSSWVWVPFSTGDPVGWGADDVASFGRAVSLMRPLLS